MYCKIWIVPEWFFVIEALTIYLFSNTSIRYKLKSVSGNQTFEHLKIYSVLLIYNYEKYLLRISSISAALKKSSLATLRWTCKYVISLASIIYTDKFIKLSYKAAKGYMSINYHLCPYDILDTIFYYSLPDCNASENIF